MLTISLFLVKFFDSESASYFPYWVSKGGLPISVPWASSLKESKLERRSYGLPFTTVSHHKLRATARWCPRPFARKGEVIPHQKEVAS